MSANTKCILLKIKIEKPRRLQNLLHFGLAVLKESSSADLVQHNIYQTQESQSCLVYSISIQTHHQGLTSRLMFITGKW